LSFCVFRDAQRLQPTSCETVMGGAAEQLSQTDPPLCQRVFSDSQRTNPFKGFCPSTRENSPVRSCYAASNPSRPHESERGHQTGIGTDQLHPPSGESFLIAPCCVAGLRDPAGGWTEPRQRPSTSQIPSVPRYKKTPRRGRGPRTNRRQGPPTKMVTREPQDEKVRTSKNPAQKRNGAGKPAPEGACGDPWQHPAKRAPLYISKTSPCFFFLLGLPGVFPNCQSHFSLD